MRSCLERSIHYMTNKFFIGIDPGIGGGVAVLDENGGVFSVDSMPIQKVGNKNKLALNFIKDELEHIDSKIIVIERQQAYPKQGVTSCFTIGMGAGQLEGLCVGLGKAYTIIVPQDWQRVMFRGRPKGKPKDHSKAVAQQLFPNVSFKKTDRCTNIHDGMTDAVLIAEYARRKFK